MFIIMVYDKVAEAQSEWNVWITTKGVPGD
jgi:hypothetical protein